MIFCSTTKKKKILFLKYCYFNENLYISTAYKYIFSIIMNETICQRSYKKKKKKKKFFKNSILNI